MKKSLITIKNLVLLTSSFVMLTSAVEKPPDTSVTDPLRQAAFQILNTKCNVCHRKQNPFMVFKQGNIDKRASRIYNAVFVTRRMPKGERISLTTEEYAQLKAWLATKIDE